MNKIIAVLFPFVLSLTAGAFASTPAAVTVEPVIQQAALVEIHALNADQAQALADARAAYRLAREALDQAHKEEVSRILGRALTLDSI